MLAAAVALLEAVRVPAARQVVGLHLVVQRLQLGGLLLAEHVLHALRVRDADLQVPVVPVASVLLLLVVVVVMVVVVVVGFCSLLEMVAVMKRSLSTSTSSRSSRTGLLLLLLLLLLRTGVHHRPLFSGLLGVDFAEVGPL